MCVSVCVSVCVSLCVSLCVSVCVSVCVSLMHPSILGIIGTGSPEDINGWVVHTLALRVQFSLWVHRTSCTLD